MKKTLAKVKYFAILPTLLLLQVTSCGPSSKKMFSKAIASQPYDVMIVPGLPFDTAELSELLRKRLLWANYLYKKGIAKNVIFSGSAVYTPYTEAKIMAMYGEAMGIPRENIFIETKAEHSTENLYNSYIMARELGFERIALASDPYQGRFLYIYARKKDIPVNVIPLIDNLLDLNQETPEIDYQRAFIKNFVSLKQRKTFFQRLRGTRGKNIGFQDEEKIVKKEASSKQKDF